MNNVFLTYTKISEEKKTAHIIWKKYKYYPRIIWFPWERVFSFAVTERIAKELDELKQKITA